jgi:hypothetical protein
MFLTYVIRKKTCMKVSKRSTEHQCELNSKHMVIEGGSVSAVPSSLVLCHEFCTLLAVF